MVSVLRRHGESNASVAESGLEAIINLAYDAGNNTKLGACDACAGGGELVSLCLSVGCTVYSEWEAFVASIAICACRM